MSMPQTNPSTISLLVIVAVVGGVISLTAVLTMPTFRCGPLSYKWTDFMREENMRTLELCTRLGGELLPASGGWIAAVGGLIFFGAGGAAYQRTRPNRRAGPAYAATREPPAPPPGVREYGTSPRSQVWNGLPAETSPRSPMATQPPPANPGAVDESVTPTNRSSSPFTDESLAERLEQARPASFGNRVPAFLIDLLAVAVVALIIIVPVQLPFQEDQREGSALGGVYLLIIAGTFIAYHWALGITGGTLGMRAFQMRIIRVDGAPLDSRAALVRALILFLGTLVLLGPSSGLWHREGRAWHDLASGTGVVRL